MFDGMHHQDQLFHQFISSSSSSPPPSFSRPPPPPPSSLHQHHHNHLQQINCTAPFPNFGNSLSSFPTPLPPPSSHQSIQFHDLFHRPNLPSSFPYLNQAPPLPQPHHLIIPKQYNDNQQSHINTDLAVEVHHQKDVGLNIRSLLPAPPSCGTTAKLATERERFSSSSSLPHHHQSHYQSDDIWSNEEVVALLRIRSSSESSWFPPEFTWEHVSRKLAEIGFKRSAEKCKEKFEEESRTYFNTAFNINTYNNNGSGNRIHNASNNTTYKGLGELEDQSRGDDNIENKAANADYHEDQDPINNNNDHHDTEVDEIIGCEKCKMYNNVFEGIRAADEINEDNASYPSPIDHIHPEQPVEPHQQLDHLAMVEGGERQLRAKAKKRIRKRSKEHKFKIMKGLCQGFVNKMMNQQEELHNKILNDLFKRDEENVAREEAWKRMEMERLNTEIETREHEQATAGDRQAAIIEFLSKFSTTASASSSSHQNQNQCIIDENIVADLQKVLPKPISHISKVLLQNTQVENDQIFDRSQNPSDQTPCLTSQNLLHEALEPQTPTSTIQPNITMTKLPPTSNPPALPIPSNYTTTPGNITTSALVEYNPKPSTKKWIDQGQDPNSTMGSSSNNGTRAVTSEDYGKRWPRDEILALINLRCSFMNNNNNNGDEDSSRDINGSKAPLWERISQKMSEMGFKRSAKRCKEKWENINKYFRKTKDNVNKKRSLDSKTCPYFHQLSHLYNQGTLIAPTNESENQLCVLENRVSDALEDATAGGGHAGDGGDKKNMQE